MRYPMNFPRTLLSCAAILFAILLPSARLESQLAPLPDEPLAALDVLQKANDDLLKRQDDTLKALTDATSEANEIRIYSRRG